MAFDVNTQEWVATSQDSGNQSRQICALMGLPEDSALMENVDIQAFRDGRAAVTVRIAKVLTVEEHMTLRAILGLDRSILASG